KNSCPISTTRSRSSKAREYTPTRFSKAKPSSKQGEENEITTCFGSDRSWCGLAQRFGGDGTRLSVQAMHRLPCHHQARQLIAGSFVGAKRARPVLRGQQVQQRMAGGV